MATKNMRPFEPLGNTILVAADATAPSGAATVTTARSAAPMIQFRIFNSHATVLAHVAFAETAALALAAAVVPTGSASNAKAAYGVPPMGVEIITAPRDSFWSGISASAVSVFITPGVGA